MTLHHYGVVIGTLDHFTRDSEDNFGKYFHGHIFVNTPNGQYEGAVDVSVPNGYKIHYRVVRNLNANLFSTIAGMSDGFHLLASNSTSGALDYVRDPLLRMTSPAFPFGLTQVNRMFANVSAKLSMRLSGLLSENVFSRYSRWIESSGNNALDAMESVVNGCQHVYVFGEKFNSGLGVHDVHMNQGDPAGSQWYGANGVWQDGGTIVRRPNGSLTAFLTKFSNQTMNTDSNGNPK